MMQIETVSEVLHGTVSPDRPQSNNKMLLHKIRYLFVSFNTSVPYPHIQNDESCCRNLAQRL